MFFNNTKKYNYINQQKLIFFLMLSIYQLFDIQNLFNKIENLVDHYY